MSEDAARAGRESQNGSDEGASQTGARRLRWRGWRARARIVLVLMLIGAVVNIGATIHYGRKVKAAKQELKAQGMPVTFADIAPPPVAEGDNAAPLYLEAAAIIERHESNPGYGDEDWYGPEKLAALTRLVSQDQRALELVAQATSRPQCRFDVEWEKGFEVRYTHLGEMRSLARFLRTAAIAASREGDQAEALERLRMGFVLARHMSNEPPLIGQLVAYAIARIAIQAAEFVLSHGPVPEREARMLLAELRKEQCIQGLVAATQGERAMGLGAFELMRRRPADHRRLLGDDSGHPPPLFWTVYSRIARPLIYADELVYLGHMRELEAAFKLSGPAQLRRVAAWEKGLWSRHPVWAVLSRDLTPVFTKVGTMAHRCVARMSLLQTALGLEVYKQKRGEYPERLEELSAINWPVPKDPCSGKDLVYRREGARFALYSVGTDLKDDGGKPNPRLLISFPPPKPGAAGVHRVPWDEGDIPWLSWEETTREWTSAER